MGCSQFLAIVTKSAKKFGYKSFCGHSLFFFFFLDIHPGMEFSVFGEVYFHFI